MNIKVTWHYARFNKGCLFNNCPFKLKRLIPFYVFPKATHFTKPFIVLIEMFWGKSLRTKASLKLLSRMAVKGKTILANVQQWQGTFEQIFYCLGLFEDGQMEHGLIAQKTFWSNKRSLRKESKIHRYQYDLSTLSKIFQNFVLWWWWGGREKMLKTLRQRKERIMWNCNPSSLSESKLNERLLTMEKQIFEN